MKTKTEKYLKRTITMALLNTAILGEGAAYVSWTEGEDFTEIKPRIESAIGSKLPASGGKCLAGSAFLSKGHEVVYDLDVPVSMDHAVLKIRYARLHVLDWKAAEIRILLEGVKTTFDSVETFDQTGGWGTNGGDEWGFKTIQLGAVPVGSYRLTLRSEGPHCNLNLDGFFLAEDKLDLGGTDVNRLDRIKLSSEGYWGIAISNKAVEQDAFPDLEIQACFWNQQTGTFNVDLKSIETGKVNEVEKCVCLDSTHLPIKVAVPGGAFAGIPDGRYIIEVTRLLDEGRLSIPVVAMGDLYRKAALRADSYAAFEQKILEENRELHDQVGADFLYSVEYIKNTLVLLRSKGNPPENADETRKRALAYMEKSKNRSAEDFADDLSAIIDQFDETIQRIDAGDTQPYSGRTGDFRRAFFSARDGHIVPYRVAVPDGAWKRDENKFLLTLHGGGGDENYFPENSDGKFKEEAARLGYIFASPRAVSRYRNGEEQDMKQLVGIMQAEYPGITKDRTYCTGVSMGGFGTYHLATTFPGLFRAVACVSSGGGRNMADGSSLRNADLSSLEHTPILIIHGADDSVVPVERATNLAEALEERGYVHELEVFAGHGHAYDGELYLNRTDRFFSSLEN